MAGRTREGDESIRAMLHNLGVGVFTIGDAATGIVTYANPAYARILGFHSVEEAIGSSVFDHYADPGERKESFARFLADPQIRKSGFVRFEAIRLRKHDRRPVPVLLTLQVTLDESGRPRRIDGVIEETEARRAAEKAFRASEERFRLFFESSPAAMALTNSVGLITRVNPAMCAFLGASPEELVGTNLDQWLHSEETDRPVVGPAGADVSHSRPRERRFVRKDGTPVWGASTLSWMRDEDMDEHATTVGVSILDVTERRRAAEEMLRVEKLESLAGLAGGIAHDFNNILTAILGNLSLALSDGAEGVLRDRIEAAEQASLRARELTQQLITFARGGAPVKRAIDLAELIRGAARLCTGGSKVQAHIDLAPDLATSECDPGQINQVFSNLFINAVQAMPEGGNIYVRARNVVVDSGTALPLAAGRYVQVEVLDDGPGIPEVHRGRVFDPYFSTKPHGSGLGLAIAHSVVARHGGYIGLAPEQRGGASFVVYLPASCKEAVPVTVPERAPPPALLPDARILVMDDEPLVRRVAAEILRTVGYEVDTVPDGAAALVEYGRRLAAGVPYAAVVLDLTVPGGLGGIETACKLREIDPKVRAIVSSGYSSDPVMSDYRRHGFSGVVTKPYTVAEFGAVLRQVLEGG